MNKNIIRLALCAFAMTCCPSFAQTADDTAWINRCVRDNKREGATPAVVRAYCTCMNGEMGDNETLSITAWEQRNPQTMAMCSKKAGWN
jgi:hypothetical protein